ncbi:T9SS type A sorting domain-containing protein [Rhodocytophaga rosea]|uniref:T9SS type A sorting domain-containing protein n=1 Tax=Rhodocytophaga rosea TaxID=2704465 RepID=A0A6C0GGP5_9BACT|nr:Ig-like domain-containing protein [Rhodocytophaga rosea]QHT67168.1 T9SS type A sorting domain-containing protein [Rhodocytophaga rosea]
MAQGTGLPTGFTDQLVSGSWNAAVGFTFNPAGTRMYVWEKGGKVWIVENGVKLSTPLIDISDEVGDWKDHGLLGFALHPNFESNGYFYLLYVVDRHHLINSGTVNYDPTVNEYNRATIGRITRYRANPLNAFKTADLSSRTILLGATASTGLPILQVTHGVGSIVFGTDQTLLVSLGDGSSPLSGKPDVGSSGESYFLDALADGIITPEQNVGAFRSQQLESLNGKIIRIDPETGNGVPSNPFYDPANPGSNKSKAWALGLRNPSRMSLKPGTGSHNPSEGNPGVLYLGDVGWDTWEEMDVVPGPGLNFGWPIYEGYEASLYSTKTTQNQYSLNPLYGVGGCTQRYFSFIDLLKQPTANGQVSFPNPCNTSQQIPASVPHFVHTRPVLDWKHGTSPSRTGTFNGNDASVVNLGSAGSVPGPQFGGSSAIGGVWYTGDKFPAEYQNKYFLGDYGAKWIRSLSFDNTHNLQQVENFINGNAIVVYMNTHPTDGALYYINYASQIRKVTYIPSGNQPPTAIASMDKYYGISPLTIQFTGSNSTDPEALPLAYEWNFGDGSPVSNLPNPSKIFNAPAGVPTKYNITLKVTDNQGLTNETSLFVSVNNTPPVVNITSPVNNSKYTMTQESTVNLTANVTDTEHSSAGLTYQWQTILYHNDHNHPEPYDNDPSTTATIIPIGCDGNLYYFEFVLIVTDGAGLSDTASVRMDPDCASLPSNITALSATASDTKVNLSWTNPSNTFDELMIVAKEALSVTADPAGDGSAYQADLNFLGIGSTFDGGKVVYKGNVSPKTITGLTNNNRYYFKVFTRKGSIWSIGAETSAVPRSASNIAPVVSLTSPVNNISYTQGADVTIQATASDSDGNIAKVEFYAGTAKLGEDLTSPYSFTWKNTPAGSYAITTKAYDNLDAVTTSGAITININSFSNTSFYRAINLNGTALTIDGNAWEASTAPNYTLTGTDGVLNKNGTSVFPSTDANRTLMLTTAISGKSVGVSINNVPNGEYDVYVYVWEDNRAILVNFSVEGQPALQGYNTGYAGYWEKLGPWRATITDGNINLGINGGSESILLSGIEIRKIETGGNNALPTANLTSPANNSTFTASSNITLTATAADTDGSISKVEFYQGLTKLGEDLASPYEFIWNHVAAGSYQLTAKAIDNLNGTGISTVKTITVTQSNQPPVVNLTSPINNQAFTAPASINIIAQASDGDGNISKVEFYRGTTKLGEDLTSPYEYSWANIAAGSYQLTAKAFDNLNATGTSSIVNITVSQGNQAPIVSLTAPANNSTFTAGSNITLTATASDNDGSVSKVEFYQGTTKLGEDLTSPYEYVWTNVSAGSYQLTAKATDNQNISTISSNISIAVTSSNQNQPPIVSLSTPNGSPGYSSGDNITFVAAASDADGSVSKVEFYQGSTKLGEDLTSPYEFTWSNVAAGSYQITAIATDNLNAVTTSSVISITVSPAAAVSFYRALNLNGGTLTIDTRTFEASATAPGFTYSGRVFANQNITLSPATDAARASMIRSSIYSLASAPASLALSGVSNGEYDLYLYVWEDSAPEPYSLTLEGQVILSNYSTGGKGSWAKLGPYRTTIADGILNIGASGGAANLSGLELWKVNQPNQLPTVALTSPANNASFTAGNNITLTATASDADGTVSKVEFYQGTTKIGEDLTSPYEFAWTNVAAGSYQLTAKAIDNVGDSSTSAVVNTTVSQANQAPTVTLTSPVNNTSFMAPASVTLAAAASDADGSVSKVEFYQGSTKLGEDLTSPYEFTWSNVAAGSYQITAIATDNLNAVTTSSVISITVSPAAAVSFYRALNLNGGTLTIDTRTFEASATAPGFTYSGRVFANQNITLSPATDAARASMIRSSIYSLASAPASLALSGVSNGEYDLYLYVWEDSAPEPYSLTLEGQVILSNYSTGGKGSWAKLGPYRTTIADGILNIGASGGAANLSGLELWKVNQPNQLPTVALTSPANNASFTAGNNITLTATASDADGTVSKVEFYQGTTKIGEDLTSPYEFAWTNVAAGSYQLTAKAIDNVGDSSTSATTTLIVNAAPTISFYRALNLNGGTLTIDTRTFEASATAPGFTYSGRVFANQNITLSPATDAARASMIRSSIYSLASAPASLALSGVSNGEYDLYLYVWEDSAPEPYSLTLEGQVILSNYSTGGKGSWAKLGPYRTTIADGILNIGASGGAANLSGLELWKVSSNSRVGDELEEVQGTSTELLAYPVPASKEISFEFSFPEQQQVTMQLFDTRGNLVANLFDQQVEAAHKHWVVYQVGNLANGVYLVRLAGKHTVKHQKIIIDKH